MNAPKEKLLVIVEKANKEKDIQITLSWQFQGQRNYLKIVMLNI